MEYICSCILPPKHGHIIVETKQSEEQKNSFHMPPCIHKNFNLSFALTQGTPWPLIDLEIFLNLKFFLKRKYLWIFIFFQIIIPSFNFKRFINQNAPYFNTTFVLAQIT